MQQCELTMLWYLNCDFEKWQELLPTVPLGPNSRHLFHIDEIKDQTYRYVKLHMIPDGQSSSSIFRSDYVVCPLQLSKYDQC